MYKLVEDSSIYVEKLVPGGQGLATLEDGKKAFFWNALPGEIVTEYEIFKKKSKYIEATATKLTNLSPHRIQPKDNVHLSTSPWQIMDYTYELDQKLELLKESFRQEGLDCPARRVQTDGKQFAYRNKMEYSLYWDIEAERIRLAFRKRGTHRKEPITSSSLERPEIYEKALTIVNDLNARGEEAYKYQSLLLRANQRGEVSGGLYENGKPHPAFPNLTDRVLGHEYSYSPGGFFQINLPVYEMALREIQKYIMTEEVLDLYAGVGTIGLSVAADRDLTLVESNREAFTELKRNCWTFSKEGGARGGAPGGAERSEHAGEENARQDPRSGTPKPIFEKSENVTDHINNAQTVILDPPRAGCDRKLLGSLLEKEPPVIVYLSCNPSTQARDLKILSEKYQIRRVLPFNFFPRTPHLENLVILSLE